MRVRLILCFIVIVMSWGVAVALTPSEIYKEHKSDIRQGEFFIYDEHLHNLQGLEQFFPLLNIVDL